MDSKEKQRNKRMYDTYGITLDEWNTLTKSQYNCCFICGNKNRLNQDHRHIKNYKKLSSEEKRKECRGALCYRCNKWTVGGLEIHKNARKILKQVNLYFDMYKMKGDL